jgi:competence protein ComEA
MLPPILSSLAARVSWAPRRGLVLALALLPALLAAVLIGIFVFVAPSGAAPAPPAPAAVRGGAALPPPAGVLIEVSGAVVHPGMYRVAKGDRAAAAIAAAGGFAPNADPSRLPNMAARLQDGQQIVVPALGAPARSSSSRVQKVSLNSATAEQLAAVPGFTSDLAAAVITYRTEYGGFATTRELVDVLAMSESDYVLARRYVTI